jgi:hypothetical protein
MNLYSIVMNMVDEFGNPVERTKFDHPYSYDGYVTYRNGKNEEATSTVYSDRILRQDYEKTRKLMKKHFGDTSDYYNDREPEKIEEFLSEYLDKKIKIIFIMEYCNKSSGYPLWRFDYCEI